MIRKAIFIDGSFLFHNSQNQKVRLDYGKLKDFLVNPEVHYLVSASYFTAIPSDRDIEDLHKGFLKKIKKDLQFRVHTVPLLKIDDSFRYSKGEDILLVCELVKGALMNHWDEAILVSGDGDFVPAINMVQSFGKRVIVYAFKNSISHLLSEACEVRFLDDELVNLKLK